jgi:hypothetical protein
MRLSVIPVVLALFVLSGPFAGVSAEERAPFGLAWGASVEHLKAAGVVLQRRNSDQSGVRFAATSLPKALSDMGEAILSFGGNNRLHKIEAIGEDVTGDPDGRRMKARYAALSRALAGKYGQGVSRHEILEPWTRPNDFLTGIYRGGSHWYTDFTGKNVSIRLQIRATRRGISKYVLIFQHKEIRPGNERLPERDVL